MIGLLRMTPKMLSAALGTEARWRRISGAGREGEEARVTVWSGITAKELSVQMLEGDGSEPAVVMQLNHVGYLGRELVRAEQCLRSGAQYVQD